VILARAQSPRGPGRSLPKEAAAYVQSLNVEFDGERADEGRRAVNAAN